MTAGTVEPAATSAEALGMTLVVLGERIAQAVEMSRREGDVPDDRRGAYFPLDLIVRDARSDPAELPDIALTAAELPSSLLEWAAAIGLSDRELSALLIAASPSLDPRFEHFFIVLNNEVETRGPSIATTLRLLGADPADPQQRALFDADARLRGLGLVSLRRMDQVFPSRTLEVSERVVRHLLGDTSFDPVVSTALRRETEPAVPVDLLPDEPSLPTANSYAAPSHGVTVVRAHPGSGALSRAIAALAEDAREVLVLDGAALPADAGQRAEQVRAALTEAALAGTALIIDDRPVSSAEAQADADVLESTRVPVLLLASAKAALREGRRSLVDLPPAPESLRSQWWSALGATDEPALQDLLQRLEPEQIRARLAGERTDGVQGIRLAEGLARQAQPGFLLSDVIVPDEVRVELIHLLDRVRLRPTVIDAWGMRPGGLRGRGITALFAGESGTGKTMAAEALAGELGVPLFHVNLSSVIDKYIGETEKNLDRVFTEAEGVDGVLLFDEADALFGKRSQVSDARDRHANLEVAFLLQRMESFDGLAILTTNLRSNLDPAFSRRLDCILDFPEPDADLRATIWRLCLAEGGADLDDEHIATLATLDFPGGAIRSSALSAAYMAAAEGSPIDVVHALRGARREWLKLGRLSFPLEATLDQLAAERPAAPDGSGPATTRGSRTSTSKKRPARKTTAATKGGGTRV